MEFFSYHDYLQPFLVQLGVVTSGVLFVCPNAGDAIWVDN